MSDNTDPSTTGSSLSITYSTISDIPVPEGYRRVDAPAGSFAYWLRNSALRKDNQVFLYNGELKTNQSVQFAVLDVAVGKKDLQQCADAIMRLRAEYLISLKKGDNIQFQSTSGQQLSFRDWRRGIRYKLSGNRLVAWQSAARPADERADLEAYLEFVFTYCGTLSLQSELKQVHSITAVEAGDVFVKGGSPGHAMIVMDVAINKEGKKIIMLAQSYMPAQDIHVVKNPGHEMSPWYETEGAKIVDTPEWVFEVGQLRRWKM